MVLQMIDVVAHEVVEGHGAIAGYRTKRALVEVVHGAASRAIGGGRRRHHSCEMPVVRQPEHDELGPRRLLIALARDPFILLVAVDHEIVSSSHSDETLVVVA